MLMGVGRNLAPSSENMLSGLFGPWHTDPETCSVGWLASGIQLWKLGQRISGPKHISFGNIVSGLAGPWHPVPEHGHWDDWFLVPSFRNMFSELAGSSLSVQNNMPTG